MKIVATIEVRMTSSRLPGKPMLKVLGKTMIERLVSRLKKVKAIDCIVLATTTNKSDDVLVDLASKINIFSYRGSEQNVMNRVINAAESVEADVVVEITGDCPIIDPELIEQAISMFKINNVDYLSNGHFRSYPDGMDVQVFTIEAIKKSEKMTNSILDQEHVTLHIRNNPNIFKHLHIYAPPELYWPELGLTLDEKKDFDLLKVIIEHFEEKNYYFSCLEIIRFLRERPDIVQINSSVVRKGDT